MTCDLSFILFPPTAVQRDLPPHPLLSTTSTLSLTSLTSSPSSSSSSSSRGVVVPVVSLGSRGSREVGMGRGRWLEMGVGSRGREVGRGRGQEDWAPPPCPSLLSKQRRYREECRPPWSEIRGVKKTAYMECSIKTHV